MSTHMADDGFAGAGGWDLAAEALGIHARGVENMPEARATREAAGLTTIHDDVWTFTPDGRAIGKIDSPPCQTFSAAGKGSGRKALEDVLSVIASGAWTDLSHLKEMGASFGDDRTALVLTPLHFATGYEYEWLAWEQVPTVLPVWEACAAVLRELGWFTWTGLLQAEMYGVPQTRKRAFLLASRLGPVAPPTPTHGFPRTLSQSLGWGSSVEVHHVRGAGMTERHGARPGRRGDEPCFTITGKARSWIVADGDDRRPFSIEEASVVQSFPKSHPWQGSRSKQFQLCGNAVPPLLAFHALGAAAVHHLSAKEAVA